MGNGQPKFPYPDQVPRFDIPGAEYFALAPHAQIAVNGMRSKQFAGTATSVPASTTANLSFASAIIESPYSLGSAVYLRRVFGIISPADLTGQLQVVAARIGLSTALNGLDWDLGLPVATFSTPASAIPVISDRDTLITAQDMIPAISGFTGNLALTLVITVKNNDGAAAHSATAIVKMIWARLDGFTQ